MLRIQAALREFTGSLEISVFQTLSAGNIGQRAAPGTVVPPPAGRLPDVLPAGPVLAGAVLAGSVLAGSVLAGAALAGSALAGVTPDAAAAAGAALAAAATPASAGPAALPRAACLLTCATGVTCAAQAATVLPARIRASAASAARRPGLG
jgi:hypothetical protein